MYLPAAVNGLYKNQSVRKGEAFRCQAANVILNFFLINYLNEIQISLTLILGWGEGKQFYSQQKNLGKKIAEIDGKALMNCHDCRHVSLSGGAQKAREMCLNYKSIWFVNY